MDSRGRCYSISSREMEKRKAYRYIDNVLNCYFARYKLIVVITEYSAMMLFNEDD